MQFEGRKPLRGTPNLVPLINIVFLLLIFFMLSSTLTTPDRFDIELPKSEAGRSHGAEPIVVLVGPAGEVAVNNEAVSLANLAERLATEMAAGNAPEVMVKADSEANTGDIVTVLRRARAAGVERVALATQAVLAP